MAAHNLYLQYKSDTSKLIHWIIQTANRIPSHDSLPSPLAPITTNSITLSTLLSLSEVIAARVKPIPSSIYKCFKSAISARQAVSGFYKSLQAGGRNEELEKSNASHKAFIDVLISAFKNLGGEEWEKSQASRKAETEEVEEDEQVLFINTFDPLNDNQGTAVVDDDHDRKSGDEDEPAEKHVPKMKKGKGKVKGSKKVKSKKATSLPKTIVEDYPMESYKIVHEEGIITEYLLAIYCLMEQMISLRGYTQQLWNSVSKGHMHCAVAGTMSNIAISIIREAQFPVQADFPGRGSFGAIISTLTGGDPDSELSQIRYRTSIFGRVDDNDDLDFVISGVPIDIKENFGIWAYGDLLAFITDFQKNRNGKPTKAMMAKLHWDPMMDLLKAGEEKRVQWRSTFTINWLYDLVNIYSSRAMRKNGMKNGNICLEKVDWAAYKGCGRLIWGPSDFAADITAMAMSKPSTSIASRIMPHHVFQLQCIVDSMTVVRGYTNHPIYGGLVAERPDGDEWHNSAMEDINSFISPETRSFTFGGVSYIQLLKHEQVNRQDEHRHKLEFDVLQELLREFHTSLGTSPLSAGLFSLPPSRFSATDSNGLWEYCPYLCGTGLVEALNFVFRYSMFTWDKHPEPMSILHLYNMLARSKHIAKEIPFFEYLIQLFGSGVFVSGKPPTRNFHSAWLAACKVKVNILGHDRNIVRVRHRAATNSVEPNITAMFPPDKNLYFNTESMLSLLCGADWMPGKISDNDVHLNSVLAYTRLAQTKAERKNKAPRLPKTAGENQIQSESKLDLVDTPLLKRMKATGKFSDDIAQILAQCFVEARSDRAKVTSKQEEQLRRHHNIPDDYKFSSSAGSPISNSLLPSNVDNILNLDNIEYLKVLELDIMQDVTSNALAEGHGPYSSLNYFALLTFFMVIFFDIKQAVSHTEIGRQASGKREQNSALVTMAMETMDEELLTILAKCLEKHTRTVDLGEFMYWRRMEGPHETIKRCEDDDVMPGMGPMCSVM